MYFKDNKKQWPGDLNKRTPLKTMTALIGILHFIDSLWDRRLELLIKYWTFKTYLQIFIQTHTGLLKLTCKFFI